MLKSSILVSVFLFLFKKLVFLNAVQVFLKDLDFNNLEISGPSLNKNAQLPYHYFYLIPKFQNNTIPSSSILDEDSKLPLSGDKIFKITLTHKTYNLQSTIRSRSDGTYVVIFKIHGFCDLIKLLIKIPKLPKFKKVINLINLSSSECKCPNPDINSWLEENNCDKYLKHHENQLKYDFEKFKGSIDLNVAESQFKTWKKGSGNAYAVCKYVVKDNKIFRDCAGKHVGFSMFSDEYLSAITSLVKLPDIEFIQNLGDWPLSFKSKANQKHETAILPIVSWCGSTDTFDVILPTYEYTRTVLQGFTQNDIFYYENLNDEYGTLDNFKNKLNTAVFRGRDSNQERLDLAKLSNKYPNDIDAGITIFFFFPKDEKITKERIPMQDFTKYKYIISLDGTVAAYRMPYLLAMSSLIFKQKSKYFEHFYRGLEKDTHYIEIKRDISDIREKIDFARKNEEKVINMIKKAKKRAQLLLEPISVLCYHVEFFKRWNKLQNRQIELTESMEKIDLTKGRYGMECRNCFDEKYGERKEEL